MLLKELTEVYEKVRGTTKKLEKIAIVSELLRKTPSETLPQVCYMLRGRIFPEIVKELKKIRHSFILDCEIIPFERSPKAFQELIKRLRRKHRVEEFAERIPVKRYLFDPGKRGIEWLKLKPEAETLDLVVIAVEYGHGKRAKLLSDYTFAIRDGEANLAPIAKAYCGLKERQIEEMTQHFKGIAMEERGRTFLVEPEVVVELKFGEVQKSSLYKVGYALRFPRMFTLQIPPPKRMSFPIDLFRSLFNLPCPIFTHCISFLKLFLYPANTPQVMCGYPDTPAYKRVKEPDIFWRI